MNNDSESIPRRPRSSGGFLLAVFLVFLLFIGSPWWGELIAYHWNRGIERAKAEVAAQLLAELPEADQRIAWVVKAAAPSIVGIHTIAQNPVGIGKGIGSGVIVGKEGYILTNYHVIADAHSIDVKLSDGRTTEAMIVGIDRICDLAVLQIGIDNLTVLPWGDSRHVSVGERVVAIGNPYDLQQTVTSGIISAVERYGPAGTGRHHGSASQEFLQTDAAINPGNSGGALVDMSGKLIGINTAMLSAEHGGNSGIGFAIPSSMAKLVYETIVEHGEMKHGWIGAVLEPVREFDAKQMNQPQPKGAVVVNVFPHSPAEIAGLRRGDILLKWGETEIEDPLHLIHTIILTSPETKKTVEVFRNGKIIPLEITVRQRPAELN